MLRRSSRANKVIRCIVGIVAVGLVLPTLVAGGAGASVDDGPTLRDLAESDGILIGSGAIRASYLEDPRFATTLAEQFGSLSPDNDLKFDQVEPQQGVFNFDPLDTIVEFAEDHEMEVKGHGLISSAFNPSWLTNITDPEEFRAAAFNHFDTVMDRYEGRMDRWDVATEGLSTFGGTGLTENIGYQRLGPDYLVEVFQMARDADPDAMLFLNESLVEYYPAKAQELHDLVVELDDQGLIDGVGIEMHATVVGPPAGALTSIIDSYQALGLEVAMTEIDVHTIDAYAGGPGMADVVQGQIYGAIVGEALAAGVTDINFWGFADAVQWYTWLPDFSCLFGPADYCANPTMFDEDYEPKPAYFATRQALYEHVDDEDPTVTVTTPADGATYIQNQSVTVDFTCADEWGDWSLDSCVGDLPDGANIDTTVVGPHDFSVTATDVNGNSTTVVADYVVVDSAQTAVGLIRDDVEAIVDDGTLKTGFGHALVTKFDAAVKQLDKSRVAAAVAQLNAAVTLLEDFVAKGQIPTADGNELIAELHLVVAALT